MRRIAVTLFVLCLACPLFAQEGSATLTGFIQDSSKAVIPGVKVTAIGTNTNQRFTATTGKDGSYTIVSLPVGPYQMQIEKPGFKTILKDDLVLHTQDALQINFQMAVGSTSETVTVNGSATNESPAISVTITREFVDDMPLNGRSFQDLLSLAPGSVNNSGYYSIDGQRNDANNFSVDGVTGNTAASLFTSNVSPYFSGGFPAQTASGTTQSLASVDDLQEFQIQTSGYTAEYGRQPGGQVQITTRSGTDEFHGTAFDYVRNTIFDANNWFSNFAGQPRGADHQNDFGGTFGGPISVPKIYIGKDRSFLFFSYEGLRLHLPGTDNEYVPTVAARQSAAPSAQPYLDLFPIPTNGAVSTDGLTQNFIEGYSAPNVLDSWSVRIDQALGRKVRLFSRFFDTPSNFETREQPGSEWQHSITNGYGVTAGATWEISSRLVNEARFNYTNSSSTLLDTQDSFGGATPLPVNLLLAPQALAENQYSAGEFFFTGTSLDNMNPPIYEALMLGIHTYNLVDSLSWSHRTHSVKLGADYRRASSQYGGQLGYSTNLEFTSIQEIQTGNADGNVQTGPPLKPTFDNLSLYVQDHWQIASRFSLDYGLRWDLNPPPTFSGVNQGLALTSPSTNLNALVLAPSGTPLYHTVYDGFAPRIGFAWQVSQSKKHPIVVRAGSGVFYDTGQTQGAGSYNQGTIYAYSVFAGETLPLSQSILTPPAFPSSPIIPAYNPALVDPNLRLPYTGQWNLAIDVGLSSRNTFSTSYIGNLGNNLLFRASYPNLMTAEVQGVSLVTNEGSSNYNALQLIDRGIIAPGLQVIASYTWSHAIDNVSTDNIQTTTPLRGNSDFDIRQVLNLALNYEAPGMDVGRLWGALTRGWVLSNRFQAETGYPLNVIQGYYNASSVPGIALQSIITPDIVSAVPVYLHNVPAIPGGWELNPSAFGEVPLGPNGAPIHMGSLGRNALYGPGFWNLNTAVQRNIAIREALKLQCRVEAFNIFNHPNFTNIDTFLGDTTFGQATSLQTLGSFGAAGSIYNTGGPRSLQVSLKLVF